MKKVHLVILSVLISINALADYPFDSLTVIAESGLIMRTGASLDSDIITTIPFGTIVKSYWYGKIKDTINGFADNWTKIEYGGKEGFAWEQYLSTYRFVNSEKYNKEFRISEEELICGFISYSPEFNWYGIYQGKSEGLQEIRKVEVTILFPELLQPEERVKYFDSEYFEKGLMHYIMTDQDTKAEFLIGTKNKLDERLINGYSFDPDSKNPENAPIFVYPEKPEIIKIKDLNTVTFISRDVPFLQDTAKLQVSSNYKLFLLNGEFDYSQAVDYYSYQVLNPDLEFMYATASRHASYKNPTINWYGDLDSDNKMDFILYNHNMVDHGGIECIYYLFLSSKAKNGEIIGKVAFFWFGGCYG